MTDNFIALEQLSWQKAANTRHGEDVRETLHWLDDATSKYPNVVTLQGADEIYEKWAEVEKFAVPRTLFSEDDGLDVDAEAETEEAHEGNLDRLMNKLDLPDEQQKTSVSSAGSNASRAASPSSMRSQGSSLSALSPPTSPVKEYSTPAKPATMQPDQPATGDGSVPRRLQPLFNYILWRIHQEVDPVAALESFIFLCNDQSKVNFAKGFEIRTKRLEQLRDAIGREDRDFKNRQMVLQRETGPPSLANTSDAIEKPSTVTEGGHKSPPKAPAAMLSRPPSRSVPNLIDPDAFGRDAAPLQPIGPPRSPRVHHVSPQVQRGGVATQYSPRGNVRGVFRGSVRGRGNFGAPGRGDFVPGQRLDGSASHGQIDPNSFSRPRGSGYTGPGGRKLWVPT